MDQLTYGLTVSGALAFSVVGTWFFSDSVWKLSGYLIKKYQERDMKKRGYQTRFDSDDGGNIRFSRIPLPHPRYNNE